MNPSLAARRTILAAKRYLLSGLAAALGALGCSSESGAPAFTCLLAEGTDLDSAGELGCPADYAALASEPADASIPGATSVKVVVDRADQDQLYFQNSKRYCVHWDFASTHLSGESRRSSLLSPNSISPSTTAPTVASFSARCRTTTARIGGSSSCHHMMPPTRG